MSVTNINTTDLTFTIDNTPLGQARKFAQAAMGNSGRYTSIELATMHAAIAQAETLQRIATALESIERQYDFSGS